MNTQGGNGQAKQANSGRARNMVKLFQNGGFRAAVHARFSVTAMHKKNAAEAGPLPRVAVDLWLIS
jgi:hypothetical protein